MWSAAFGRVFAPLPRKQHNWVCLPGPVPGSKYWCIHGPASVRVGKHVKVGTCVELRTCAHSEILLGDRVQIGDRAIIHAGERVSIEDQAIIGEGALIMDRNHHGIGIAAEIIQPINIGSGACVGKYAVVLPGAVVPAGAVVPELAVVTRKRLILTAETSLRLLSTEHVVVIRHRLAWLEPAVDLPEYEDEQSDPDLCLSCPADATQAKGVDLTKRTLDECTSPLGAQAQVHDLRSSA